MGASITFENGKKKRENITTVLSPALVVIFELYGCTGVYCTRKSTVRYWTQRVRRSNESGRKWAKKPPERSKQRRTDKDVVKYTAEKHVSSGRTTAFNIAINVCVRVARIRHVFSPS